MADVSSFRLADFPVHLELGARVLPQAQFTGEPPWYQPYAIRGEAIINPPGLWHTADVTASATALFITAGMGPANRPR